MEVKSVDLMKNIQFEILVEELEKCKNDLSCRANLDSVMDIHDILHLILNAERNDSRILKYLDLAKVSFDECDIQDIDFTGSNANINPQTVLKKKMCGCKLGGLDFGGKSFDGVNVCRCDFTGALNVNLDPQTVMFKSLYGCILDGVDFKDKSFVSVCLEDADLRGARNVYVNKHSVWNRNLSSTLFDESAVVVDVSNTQNEIDELRSRLQDAFGKSKTR